MRLNFCSVRVSTRAVKVSHEISDEEMKIGVIGTGNIGSTRD